MATITLARSDLFPVGTVVGIYPDGSMPPGTQASSAPGAASIATGTVAADGTLTVTNASVASYTRYLAAASVASVWNYCRVRSTLDVFDYGRAVGTGDTVSGSAALANVVATTGAFAVGQRISGPGIPGGTFLIAGSGAAWTMSATATATGTTVALEGNGAQVPAANLGATAIPSRVRTGWAAQLRQRRQIAGTS
jgi:hypothetical protein